MDVVLFVSVKACRTENEVWLELGQPFENFLCKVLAPLHGGGLTWLDGHV